MVCFWVMSWAAALEEMEGTLVETEVALVGMEVTLVGAEVTLVVEMGEDSSEMRRSTCSNVMLLFRMGGEAKWDHSEDGLSFSLKITC